MGLNAALPNNESERLARLRQLGVLDTEAEPLFDALTRAAALVAGVPIAMLSLSDKNRHWFKSSIGFDAAEVSHELAFCTHAMDGREVFEVPDTTLDPRFADNELVCGRHGIRFYAGAPIILDGVNLGTLCVIDQVPRKLDDVQKAALTEMANAAGLALTQRAEAMERNVALHDAAEASRLGMEDHVRLGHIIQATRAGIWEWDLKTGLATVDARWADQLGYQVDELPALNAELWRNHTHGDDWVAANENLQAHLRGETGYYDAEFRMRHKDGHWVWIRSRGGVIARDEDCAALTIAGTHVDISDRKAIERRQRENEAFLDRTGTVAEVGGWQLELATQAIAWTRETCRLHQVDEGHQPTLDEVLGYYPPEAQARLRLAIDEAINNECGYDLELPFVSLDGAPRWVRVVGTVERDDGVPARLVGAIQDVTTRRRAVAAMEVSERRFRRLFEQSTGLIFTHDLDGILLSINPAAARELGYAVSDMLGNPVAEFVPTGVRTTVDDYLEQVVRDRAFAGAINVRTADGSHRVWQFTSVIDDEDGAPYVLCHALDVTESKRHERQLRDWSIRDPLTGCFNRRFLTETTANVVHGESWGCIAVDLDNFKTINDRHGHERGDQVLVEVGRFLRAHVRPDDIVVRSGGDEFLILLKGADETATATICDRMHADHAQLPIRFTLGYAIRRGNESLADTLKTADERLYAVRAGR